MTIDLFVTSLIVVGAVGYLVHVLRGNHSACPGCSGCGEKCQPPAGLGDLRPSREENSPPPKHDQNV